MKLELMHLAPYLPYGLQIIEIGNVNSYKPISITMNCDTCQRVVNGWFKPILHPLSGLTKEIEVNGERLVPIIELLKPGIRISHESKCEWVGDLIVWQGFPLLSTGRMNLSINQFQKLFSWHFDIFSLLENNLAIDINNLK